MEQASYELRYRTRTEEQYTDRSIEDESAEDESAEDELKDYAPLGRPRVQTLVECTLRKSREAWGSLVRSGSRVDQL